ncbi:MAG: bifunctional lysylphosphatidylglycerol flippase/synthetase MprF [Verrucomicrobiaceae bacterium]|nr:MAG: bifunctional lysylphosphatidylglycerol flippase/synthetase MprF [Verrucomicrobiaceae bacterium]
MSQSDEIRENSASRGWRLWLWRLGIAAWLVVLGLALLALRKEWSHFRLRDLDHALSRLGWPHILLAVVCTGLSYFFNAAIDLFSLKWIGRKLPAGRALGCSFISTAFSLNAGGTLLGGGGVRMRLYTGLGLTPGEVARMAGFAVIAGWAGHALVAGTLLVLAPQALPMLPAPAARGLGAVMAVGALALALARALPVRKGRWLARWIEKCPPVKLAAGAWISSALDWLLAGLAIRALLPADTGSLGTAGFLGVVVIAQLLSAVSHVPGGMGVLELSVTQLVGKSMPGSALAAALLAYRVIFYLGPFAVAAGWMGLREAWGRRVVVRRGLVFMTGFWRRLGPRLAALMALTGGFLLMLSANTPMEAARRQWLEAFLPLTLVEVSHFLSSVAGVALLIVARGLQRRVNAAWWAAVTLSISGVVFSLLKGVDYEEAAVLGFLLACLLPFRGHFHRHARVWSRRFTLEWWLLLGGLTWVAVWLGLFASRHVEYSQSLWWRFSFESDAPRFLRGMVGMAVVFGAVILMQCLRPGLSRRETNGGVLTDGEWETVLSLIRNEPQSSASLGLLGDKRFIFSPEKDAFLMYGQHGRSRVVMGDPVGDEESWDDLLWRFSEEAEDAGCRPCFYQISAGVMPRFVDMGMRLYKLGEEARVSLPGFTLDIPETRKLRHARNRMAREGGSFEIWTTPAEVAAGMAELRAVSDAWLGKHSASEKSFSLGRFEESYLRRCPVAVVIRDGKVCAFANLWTGDGREELSVDLMRYGPDAPAGVMDFLFAEMFLWGRAQGYRWFNLGMAPLSGLRAHPLAPLWQRLGAFIYERGGAFYNFHGLRDFKNKFNPEWSPRYLAVPGAWHLPAVLVDITTLIGGGWRGVLGRRKKSGASTPGQEAVTVSNPVPVPASFPPAGETRSPSPSAASSIS